MNLRNRTFYAAFLLLITLICGQITAVFAQPGANPFDGLTKGQVFHGFRTEAIYLDDAG